MLYPLLLALTAAVVLPVPSSVWSEGGFLNTTLTIVAATHNTSTGFGLRTRTLNGTIPGPTLRVKPGDTMMVDFVNQLEDQGLVYVHNEFSAPDESNIHFHGLHISGELPSDDVTVPVLPGQRMRYVTTLPDYHMGGTHWLHPHRHGSSALQLGGGAALAVVVEDRPGSLPLQVADAPEVVLVIMQIEQDLTAEVATASGDKVFTSWGGENKFILVNGEVQPSVAVTPGLWTRFRIIHAAWEKDALDFAVDGCEMVLLAKDGVYIRDFPRSISVAPIAPGGRADIMVRCMRGLQHYDVTSYAGIIAVLTTRPGPAVPSRSFLPWTPHYPPYLADVRRTPASSGCSCSTSLDGTNAVNGKTYEPDVDLHTTYVGAVIERSINAGNHPYHQHVYPFQLIDLEETQYDRVGDWHDTMLGSFVARYTAVGFSGKVMVHCHRLMHEDKGMMATEWVHLNASDCVCSPTSRASRS
eukprot:Hpha_TRINITY_DN8173_c0_g1::TRINITY_DN8173_c0_g1_i1::g.171977::m.171977